MKRSIALLLTLVLGFALGLAVGMNLDREPTVTRRTWCPTPERREEVPPPARYPTPGEMGVVEPYLKGEPR